MTLKKFHPSKLKFSILLLLAGITQLPAQEQWVFLKHYDSDHLLNISLPLGGIGTGTVGLGGRGELRDWQIMNRPNIGQRTTGGYRQLNQEPFFSIYVKQQGKEADVRALIGPVHGSEYLDADGTPVNQHGMPRFSNASFDAAYPLGQVSLSDKTLPVSVKIKGFNPFIPGDASASGIPIAVLRYEVTNRSGAPMEVSVCGTMRNFIGRGGRERPDNNQNAYREDPSGKFRGIFMTPGNIKDNDMAWGTIALTTTESENVTYRRSSVNDAGWCRSIQHFWDDFSADGMLSDNAPLSDGDPMASLSARKTINAGETETFTFYLTWHFPNRVGCAKDYTVVGNSGKGSRPVYTRAFALANCFSHLIRTSHGLGGCF